MAARRIVTSGTKATEVEAESVSHTAAYIPNKSIFAEYVGRKISGLPDFDIFQNAMDLNMNVLLRGDTGSGKTLAGAAFAAKVGAFYYSVPCDVSIEPSAFFGKRHPGETQGEFPWIDGPVTQVVRGKCGLGDKCRDPKCISVLNISEINFMTPKISASLFPLLDGRRSLPLLAKNGEVVKAHTRLLIIGDMNPGYRGTQPLNAAFDNRFTIKLDWGYDERVERKLVKSNTLYEMVKKIRNQPDEVTTPTGTNRLLEFEKIAVKFNLDFAIANFVAGYAPEERAAIENLIDIDKQRLVQDFSPPAPKGASFHKKDYMVGDEDDENLEMGYVDDDGFEMSEEEVYTTNRYGKIETVSRQQYNRERARKEYESRKRKLPPRPGYNQEVKGDIWGVEKR